MVYFVLYKLLYIIYLLNYIFIKLYVYANPIINNYDINLKRIEDNYIYFVNILNYFKW